MMIRFRQLLLSGILAAMLLAANLATITVLASDESSGNKGGQGEKDKKSAPQAECIEVIYVAGRIIIIDICSGEIIFVG